MSKASSIFFLLIGVVLLVACSPVSTARPSEMIEGDAARGEALFHEPAIGQAPGCSNCHATAEGMQSLGPTLSSIAQLALPETGLAAEEDSAEIFLRQAILDPRAEIADGYPPMMFDKYAKHLSEQQLADLVAYLLTLKE